MSVFTAENKCSKSSDAEHFSIGIVIVSDAHREAASIKSEIDFNLYPICLASYLDIYIYLFSNSLTTLTPSHLSHTLIHYAQPFMQDF